MFYIHIVYNTYCIDIYIYIYTFTYTCTYSYTYTHINVHINVRIHTHLHIYTYTDTYHIYIYIYTYMHPSIHPCMHPSIHPSTQPATHACMHACITHTYIYIYIYIYTYTHMDGCTNARWLRTPRKEEPDPPWPLAPFLAWRGEWLPGHGRVPSAASKAHGAEASAGLGARHSGQVVWGFECFNVEQMGFLVAKMVNECQNYHWTYVCYC